MKNLEINKKFFISLSSLKLTVVCLFLLAVMVIGGTFYEVEHGILAAHERFFNSWIIMAFGFIPLPGVKAVICILAVNLIAAGFFKFSYSLRNTGLLLSHIGAAVLIAGAGIASFFIKESTLTLFEGESSNMSACGDQWICSVVERGPDVKDFFNSCSWDLSEIKSGRRIFDNGMGISIDIKQSYNNCSAYGRTSDKVDSLHQEPMSKGFGGNIPGMILTLEIKSHEGLLNHDFILYGGKASPEVWVSGADTIYLTITRKKIPLPMEISLINFNEEYYPGTTNAKSFKSRIFVSNDKIKREAVISMNRPFRFGSFTIYQTGFSHETDRVSSTLTIVENPFRFIPYISCLIIMIGLLLHFSTNMIFTLVEKRGIKK